MKQSNFNAATWSGPARGGGAARAIGKQPKGAPISGAPVDTPRAGAGGGWPGGVGVGGGACVVRAGIFIFGLESKGSL